MKHQDKLNKYIKDIKEIKRISNLNLHITDIVSLNCQYGGGEVEAIEFKNGEKVLYRIIYINHCCFEFYHEGLVNECM